LRLFFLIPSNSTGLGPGIPPPFHVKKPGEKYSAKKNSGKKKFWDKRSCVHLTWQNFPAKKNSGRQRKPSQTVPAAGAVHTSVSCETHETA